MGEVPCCFIHQGKAIIWKPQFNSFLVLFGKEVSSVPLMIIKFKYMLLFYYLIIGYQSDIVGRYAIIRLTTVKFNYRTNFNVNVKIQRESYKMQNRL